MRQYCRALSAGHILDGVESTRVLHDWWSDASKGKITNPLPPAPSLPKLPNLPAKLDPVKGAQQIGRQVGNAVSGSSGGTSFSGGGGIRTPSIPTPALPKVPTPSLPKLPTPSLPSTPKLANVPAKVDPVKAATQLGKQVGNPFDGGSGGAVQQGLQTINTNWQAAQKQATQIQKTVDNLQAQGAKAQETWDQLKAKGAKAQETWDAIKAEGTKFGDDPEGYVWQGVKREVTSKAQDAITKALPKCSCSDFETDKVCVRVDGLIAAAVLPTAESHTVPAAATLSPPRSGTSATPSRSASVTSSLAPSTVAAVVACATPSKRVAKRHCRLVPSRWRHALPALEVKSRAPHVTLGVCWVCAGCVCDAPADCNNKPACSGPCMQAVRHAVPQRRPQPFKRSWRRSSSQS
jgi:hypothetical protein